MATNQKPTTAQAAIKVNGTDLQHDLLDDLLELEVDTSLDVPDMLIMRFADETLKWVDSGPFAPGAAVVVDLPNASGTLTTVFNGEITAIEPHFPENFVAVLTIRAYDKTHRLNRGTKIKVFKQVKDSDIASQVGAACGLSVTAEATTQVHEHVFQNNMSDLAFLQERARRSGYEIVVDGSTLHFRKPTGSRGEIALTWGENLRSFSPRLSLAGQINNVTVKGWDPKTKQALVGQGTTSSSHPQTGGYATWGGGTAQQKFGAAQQTVTQLPVTTQTEAQNIAKALLDEINADYIEAEGIAFGNAALVAGKKVNVEKVGTKFSGKYIVTSAVHRYSRDGYDVYFSVSGVHPALMSDLLSKDSASPTVANPYYGVVTAIVTNNNDTENMGRVKVKYPWLDDALESNWVRIAAMGAGTQRGFFWLPEVNDEVLVAFEHGDFNRPFILGDLWNGTDKPPETSANAVANGKVKTRILKTRMGHTIKFVDDDSAPVIEITDAKQAVTIKIESTPKKLTIKSTGDVEVSATGNAKVTATGNLDLAATGNATLKATGNLNVEATGILVLKGSMVNIN